MKGLKIVLWVCGILCLSSFIFAAFPWNMISAWFQWFGYESPPVTHIIIYMFRICLVTFGMIGIFFIILARDPLKYNGMLLLAAYGALFMGFSCLIGGIRYSLPLCMYVFDVIFCAAAGILILAFRKNAMLPTRK